VATLATAVFAERPPIPGRISRREFPKAPPFEQILPYPRIKASWAKPV